MEAKLIDFKKEHLECMTIREHESFLLNDIEHVTSLENASVAKTGLYDGRIVACGGVTPFLKDLGEVWLIPSIYVKKYPKIVGCVIYKWICDVQKEYGLRRLQTTCINDELHNRWMNFLGFEKEGVLKNYYNNLDYALFSKIKGGDHGS